MGTVIVAQLGLYLINRYNKYSKHVSTIYMWFKYASAFRS